jgi:hypothetical protein
MQGYSLVACLGIQDNLRDTKYALSPNSAGCHYCLGGLNNQEAGRGERELELSPEPRTTAAVVFQRVFVGMGEKAFKMRPLLGNLGHLAAHLWWQGGAVGC